MRRPDACLPMHRIFAALRPRALRTLVAGTVSTGHSRALKSAMSHTAFARLPTTQSGPRIEFDARAALISQTLRVA